ncbi:hypothetical protein LTR80_011875 [Exophiala xenobiotica]
MASSTQGRTTSEPTTPTAPMKETGEGPKTLSSVTRKLTLSELSETTSKPGVPEGCNRLETPVKEPNKPWVEAKQQNLMGAKVPVGHRTYYSKAQYQLDALLLLELSRQRRGADLAGYHEFISTDDIKRAQVIVTFLSDQKRNSIGSKIKTYLMGGELHEWLTGEDFNLWIDRFRCGPTSQLEDELLSMVPPAQGSKSRSISRSKSTTGEQTTEKRQTVFEELSQPVIPDGTTRGIGQVDRRSQAAQKMVVAIDTAMQQTIASLQHIITELEDVRTSHRQTQPALLQARLIHSNVKTLMQYREYKAAERAATKAHEYLAMSELIPGSDALITDLKKDLDDILMQAQEETAQGYILCTVGPEYERKHIKVPSEGDRLNRKSAHAMKEKGPFFFEDGDPWHEPLTILVPPKQIAEGTWNPPLGTYVFTKRAMTAKTGDYYDGTDYDDQVGKENFRTYEGARMDHQVHEKQYLVKVDSYSGRYIIAMKPSATRQEIVELCQRDRLYDAVGNVYEAVEEPVLVPVDAENGKVDHASNKYARVGLDSRGNPDNKELEDECQSGRILDAAGKPATARKRKAKTGINRQSKRTKVMSNQDLDSLPNKG